MKNLTRLLSTVLLALMLAVPAAPTASAAPDAPSSSTPAITSPTDGATLRPGNGVRSPDGRYLLVHQHDGNVVLYGPNGALWQTATHGRDTSQLTFQHDGNLVLYRTDGYPLWHTSTTHRGETLAVQNDANLVIYDEAKAVWAIKGMAPPSYPVPLQLRKIAWCEAGSYIGLPKYRTNYRAYNTQGSSASGGYQILDGTWRTWKAYVPAAAPYARAAHAPPHIQDEVATKAYYRHGTSPWNASAGCWRYA